VRKPVLTLEQKYPKELLAGMIALAGVFPLAHFGTGWLRVGRGRTPLT